MRIRPHAALDTAAGAAARRSVADAWAWGRRQSGTSISALTAATVALWAYDHATRGRGRIPGVLIDRKYAEAISRIRTALARYPPAARARPIWVHGTRRFRYMAPTGQYPAYWPIARRRTSALSACRAA